MLLCRRMTMDMPQSLRQTILSVHGHRGARWLETLDARIVKMESRWNFRVHEMLPNLSFHVLYAAEGTEGEPLVLKLGVPSAELASEIRALHLYRGAGAVRLLRADARLGALLEERLQPGTSLAAMADPEEAMRIYADVYHGLRRPVPGGSPTRSLADWFRGLERLQSEVRAGRVSIAADFAQAAADLSRDLLATTRETGLLHGDLHHDNIILGERGWTAIDPKGIVGDPCYDTAAYLVNQLPQDGRAVGQLVQHRIAFLAQALHMAPERILGWVKAFSVLSAWWNVEDGVGDFDRGLEVARAIWAIAR